jgi:CHAT domain-containing protein/tetratricopeptide (TPR) repeat protein
MAPGDPAAGKLPPEPVDLPLLALSRPQNALTAARFVLDGQPGAYGASLAHQTIGIVLRNHGDLPGALAELREGLRLAHASGRLEREIDVQATLGATLAWSGRSRSGLAMLDRAVAASRGDLAGRVLMRRANVFMHLGRFPEAHQDLCRALSYLRRAGDVVWEARTLTHRAFVYLGLGSPGRAGMDFARAEQLFEASGQDLEYATARHNHGIVALIRGNLPEALACFDEAERRYDALGEWITDLAIDRCSALLAAGLTADAARETESALGRLPRAGGIPFKTAELLFAAASATLAAGDTAGARERARQARQLFRAQERGVWEARADHVIAEARYVAGERSVSLFRFAERTAAHLDSVRASEALRSHLLAGRLALDLGRGREAAEHLDHAARSRRRTPPLTRSVAWLARALQARARGSARGALAACRRGLDALDEHQRTLGATELRAYGTAHGAELALLAQRHAVQRGSGHRLLYWSERWRATALTPRDAPPRHDRQLVAELSALRHVTRLLATGELPAPQRSTLERERRRLEAAVRARTRRAPGSTARRAGELDIDALRVELGDGTLIEIAEIDGVLYAVTVTGRRVRLHRVGTVPEREVLHSRFLLRRLARGGPRPGEEQLVAHQGEQLEAGLLGPAAGDLRDGPVVVVPPARLQAVPWTLMPSLRDRAVTVAPSATAWLRARRKRPPAHRRVALIVGPRLATGGAEVEQLHARYQGSVLLGRGNATAEGVLRALDGAWLGHIAAHGTFRADNPLFSSIQLDDGPLTVHDFERLRRAPYWLVLSCCDSGTGSAVGADELLGLVGSLMPLGAAGIVASIVLVNDVAAVPLMLVLHDALEKGAALPEALLAMRRAAHGDLLAEATAHAFLALGA